jgi:molybdenum cofactor cytidylyltransferase
MAESDNPVEKRVAAIILAAGGSKRMGQPKLLLDWHGAPLIRWVALTALNAGCSPVVVVTGASAERVQHALDGLPLGFTHNPDWQKGQSTSVKLGVNALPENADAVIVFLGDQPHIPLRVPQKLMQIFREENPAEPILAPAFNGKRSNPVLLARAIFAPLAGLAGDAGARMIFSQYPVRLVPFDDPDLLLDVDLPEDYQRLTEIPAPRYMDDSESPI